MSANSKAVIMGNARRRSSSMNKRLLSNFNAGELEMGCNEKWDYPNSRDHQVSLSSESMDRTRHVVACPRRMNSASRCHEYYLKEILVATGEWDVENLIWNEEHEAWYRGVLVDGKKVMIIRLLRLTAGAEAFKTEAEAIQRLTHKNIVKLMGYCVESDYRILVNEYVGHGNLHQWLHGYDGKITFIPWCLRVETIRGIAKALAYLHEDIEPNMVHYGVKSSNIYVDHELNPKIANPGVGRLFGPEFKHMAEGCGDIRPEDDPVSVLQAEKADVYDFGVLVMEIITGRPRIDYSKPQAEVDLVEWLKSMVASQLTEQVLDPKIVDIPPPMELKRLLLIALKCADPEAENRPKMGEVIHMLEPRDLLLHHETHKWLELFPQSYSEQGDQVFTRSIEERLEVTEEKVTTDDQDTTEVEESTEVLDTVTCRKSDSERSQACTKLMHDDFHAVQGKANTDSSK
ncbi:hypothetical protein Drorol1_Dr00013181 [Drosera rotundifolia]